MVNVGSIIYYIHTCIHVLVLVSLLFPALLNAAFTVYWVSALWLLCVSVGVHVFFFIYQHD